MLKSESSYTEMQNRIQELERKVKSLERMSVSRLRTVKQQRTLLAKAKVQIEMLTAQVKARELI